MTNSELALSYLEKSKVRLKALELFLENKAYSDVVREAQETVELALKGMLRFVGIEPPKFHDVGGFLVEYKDRFPADMQQNLDKMREISAWLRKEREFSFYGDIDVIPTKHYTYDHAKKALDDAVWVVTQAEQVISK